MRYYIPKNQLETKIAQHLTWNWPSHTRHGHHLQHFRVDCAASILGPEPEGKNALPKYLRHFQQRRAPPGLSVPSTSEIENTRKMVPEQKVERQKNILTKCYSSFKYSLNIQHQLTNFDRKWPNRRTTGTPISCNDLLDR